MQALITVELDQPLTLPINYSHIVQGIIYKAINAMPLYSDFLHDVGFVSNDRNYKMFVFSGLEGKHSVKDKRITFYDYVSFEVRSPDPLLIHVISRYLRYYGVTFGDYTYENVEVELNDYTIESNSILIKVKSPITVYTTDLETKYTNYYSPYDADFYLKIEENFINKYQAYYDITPSSNIRMFPHGDTKPNKLVTNYKGTFINAWYGEYEIRGEKKYLDFLYQTGLGSKNAQGFGMFDVVES